MKIRNFLLPVLSLGGMVFASFTVAGLMRDKPDTPPPVKPAAAPFSRTLAGAGIIEPASELIAVAPSVAGVAVEVLVAPGQRVKKGDALLRQDARVPQAQRAIHQAEIEAAKTKLARLRAMPRTEEVAPLEQAVRELEEWRKDDKDKLDRLQSLLDRGAMQERDVVAARNALDARTAQLAKANAQLALIRAGAWKPDVVVAEAEVAAAEAELAGVATELARLTVTAPTDGVILQVNVRAGEFLPVGAAVAPIVMGEIEPLHVRVDLDEVDASRFVPGSTAEAFLRGHQDAGHAVAIEFVRTEPLVIPKRALTGVAIERIDTRVLQVIYRVAKVPADVRLYCGQQVEVFIDAAESRR